MFLILSNCHAFWDVKMLRLQKFTKPALQRQMLFPRCQAEWFDVFRCISMYFVSFFYIFLSVLQLLHSLSGDLGAWTLLQTGCEPLCQCHCHEISRTWVTYARLFQSQTDLENQKCFFGFKREADHISSISSWISSFESLDRTCVKQSGNWK